MGERHFGDRPPGEASFWHHLGDRSGTATPFWHCSPVRNTVQEIKEARRRRPDVVLGYCRHRFGATTDAAVDVVCPLSS